MERFLVNMAVVKVNFNEDAANILDTYMPLVSYALSRMDRDPFSIDRFRKEFNKFAEFNIPTGAMIALLKRAQKRDGLLHKNEDGTYTINFDNLSPVDYEAVRDEQQGLYKNLAEAFRVFCSDMFSKEIDLDDIDEYFFETLYEMSPQLFASASHAANLKHETSISHRYMVASFVMHCLEDDLVSLETITSFVRGAMLTETFYYSHPNDLKGKMRKINVYFDTQFLLRTLGYGFESLQTPCLELVDMLTALGVRMRCFDGTYDEIHRIMYACQQNALANGRVAGSKPGSVGDYFNRNGMSAADIAQEIAGLTKSLEDIRIKTMPEPRHTDSEGTAESELSRRIEEEFSTQSEAARNHDVDCVTAIHRLRNGKPQQHLESCVAIFISTNSALTRIANQFFAEQYGRSDIAVSMPDQVFTSLVWLKAVKKAPNLPRDRLVANCFAALQPTDELWAKYIEEADKLLKSGDIGETDYAELIHSLHAQQNLMDVTMGDSDFVFGTVKEILEHAKAAEQTKYIERLAAKDSVIQRQNKRLAGIENGVGRFVERTVLVILCFLVGGLYIYGLFATKPAQFSATSLFSMQNALFLFIVAVTLISALGFFNIYERLRKVAVSAGTRATAAIARRLRE